MMLADTALVDDATYSLSDDTGNSLGVAFRVHVLDTTRLGTFLLSAGHTVKEMYTAGRPVTLTRRNSTNAGPATILYCQWEPSQYDCSLLYTDTWLGPALSCGATPTQGDAIVRGSPAGVGTTQANLRAWIGGTETKDGLELVDLVLRDVAAIDVPETHQPGTNPFQRALRGLSGGPVVSALGDVVGVV